MLGKPVPRPDIPALVTARFQFVHNVRVPGMLYGSVVRPPGVGATLASVDEDSIRGVPGVVKVVVKGNFVGVVAEKLWQAVQAAYILRDQLDADGPPLPPQATFYDHLRTQKPTRDTLLVDSGDLDEKFTASRHGSESHLPSSLPDARLDGKFVRGGRRAGRQCHALVRHAGLSGSCATPPPWFWD